MAKTNIEKGFNERLFPLLNAEDIEVRVYRMDEQETELLLHKNARIDMEMLDTYVGPMNWQRHHIETKGALHCIISIYDESKGIWIEKDDAGSPGTLEPAKAEASDSFKRAATNWGIGRELYTAPEIIIPTEKLKTSRSTSTGALYCTNNFEVLQYVVEDNKIAALAIVDADTREQLFILDNRKKTKKPNSSKTDDKPTAVKNDSTEQNQSKTIGSENTVKAKDTQETAASPNAHFSSSTLIAAPENGQCTLIMPEQPKKSSLPLVPASTVDEAMNIKIDVGEAGREGKTIGDFYRSRPNRLFWVYDKTQSEIVKNGISLVVKSDESLMDFFISRGVFVK